MRFRLLLPVVLAVALLSSVGCDSSVELFDDPPGVYSVFGILDVQADTQFVRVEALQDSMLVGSNGVQARVTTTNRSTGETVIWRDTLIQSVAGTSMPFFYTTADLAPRTSYRFTARRERDGAESAAEVRTPVRPPPLEVAGLVPGVEPMGEEPIDIAVTIRNAAQVGGVRASYRFLACRELACTTRRGTFFHLDDTTRLADDAYRIAIDWEQDIGSVLGDRERFAGFFAFRVSVASVSEDWPDYDFSVGARSVARQPPPSAEISNIENGTGFLGGAAIRTAQVPITGQ